MNAHDIRIVEVQTSYEHYRYRFPLKFGGRVVNSATMLNVHVHVQSRTGRCATGLGSMPLGNIWSFPSNLVSNEETLNAMKRLAERIRAIIARSGAFAHPVELMCDLEESFLNAADEVTREMELEEPIPKLCTLVTASPFYAAVHDAYGKVHKRNVYDLYGSEYMNRDLSAYLTEEFKGEHLDKYTLRVPQSRMPLYHVVGELDPLSRADVEQIVGDGLPECLVEWIERDGITHFKVKLAGADIREDLARMLAIDRVCTEVQARRGVHEWFYSLDFNERCESAAYLVELLNRVREAGANCYERIQYIEQPTSRHLKKNSQNRMQEAARLKPIVIDEALVDFEHLVLSMEQGYSGVALKTCKGHTHALLMAAAALKWHLFLCVQDLTLVGASFLHSAGLCARVPRVAAVEGNGRQYCPAGNHGWVERWPGVFCPRDGTIETGCLTGVGLGF